MNSLERPREVKDNIEGRISIALSRSSHSRLQGWALRAVAAFLVVYMLGTFGIPTLIPYVAALIVAGVDGLRTLMPRNASLSGGRKETIH